SWLARSVRRSFAVPAPIADTPITVGSGWVSEKSTIDASLDETSKSARLAVSARCATAPRASAGLLSQPVVPQKDHSNSARPSSPEMVLGWHPADHARRMVAITGLVVLGIAR